jgi:hypothetical protein
MSFSYTYDKTKYPVRGGRMRVTGTFTDAAFAGSDIVTGLGKLLSYGVQCTDSQTALRAVESSTAGTLTVYATNDGVDDGVWWAEGV